jgi:hypothetical protein
MERRREVRWPAATTPCARIEAYCWPSRRGGVEVVRANRGYTLYSLRSGAPVARLRPTGEGGDVQVLWWRREAWGNPGPFGPEVMPLEQALDFIATERSFWIHAS